MKFFIANKFLLVYKSIREVSEKKPSNKLFNGKSQKDPHKASQGAQE